MGGGGCRGHDIEAVRLQMLAERALLHKSLVWLDKQHLKVLLLYYWHWHRGCFKLLLRSSSSLLYRRLNDFQLFRLDIGGMDMYTNTYIPTGYSFHPSWQSFDCS
jgi:hypothetical protein